ncbi:MAG TPA: marine proteobacterial sortase target protein [Candidatus Acidoferrum sp.]|nr:marine proteobacterial sortase target protein [Candidatus Acidoferrum sp.]
MCSKQRFVTWGGKLWVLAAIVILAGLSGNVAGAQSENRLPAATEGVLCYKSPVTGGYEYVPLLHTDVSIDVRGLVASGTVTQQYANDTNRPIEAIYVFPLPHDAAVYDLEIHVGNRVIRSVIKEREEAKRTYEAAKTEGKRAALVEEERPNIFTASVANLMPGDRVEVQLRYVEPLKWEDGKIRLTFPMVVGPRYIAGTQATGYQGTGWAPDTNAVPDASRITPVVRNPESREGHDISVKVELDAGFQAAEVQSISHAIQVSESAGGRKHIELTTGKTIPNKDFVLEIKHGSSAHAETALFLSPNKERGESEFLLTAYPPSAAPTKRVPVEMLYMIDISGSMNGTSIEQARAALLQALDRLAPNDRFGILAFNSYYQEFSAEPLVASADNVAAARRYVERLQAEGGTEMLPALLHLMKKAEHPGYVRTIVLLTDGDLGNEEQIFSAMHHELGNARLFTVAVGSAPNFFLATKMAQYGRGNFTHIANLSDIQDQMGRLLETIESPVLTDVQLKFEGVEATDVYPQRIPDLFLRQPLQITGRIVRGQKGVIHLTARAGDESYEASFAFDTAKSAFHPGITTVWARQKTDELMDRWRVGDETTQANLRTEIIAHAIQYRLVTRFTSLVAVEEIVANPGGESSQVAVPSELPAGMKMESVFGAPATGNADEFLEALGLALVAASLLLWFVTRRAGAAL